MRNSLDWTTSKKRRFSDILVTALSPTRRGPGSYQYRVKLKRRGPAVKHPPGFFVWHKAPPCASAGQLGWANFARLWTLAISRRPRSIGGACFSLPGERSSPLEIGHSRREFCRGKVLAGGTACATKSCRLPAQQPGNAQRAPPYATVFFLWISCRLHTRMGSRNRAATPSAAARAPLMVVMHGTR